MNRDGDKGKILTRRTAMVAGGQLVLTATLVGRMYYLQVMRADKYKMMAEENRISMRLLAPPRGLILDRFGIHLANNKQNFRAMVVAEKTSDLDKTLSYFEKIVPLTENEKNRIKKELRRSRSFVPVKIKENLSWQDMSRIQINTPDMPGIIIDEGLTRYYPYDEVGSHILGYVAAVSENEVGDDPLLQVPEFRIGKSGIEKMHDLELRGKGGSLKVEVNAYGRVIKEIERDPGTPGKDLSLTIDFRLQKLAQELLGDESGCAILMNAHTGQVLALESTPGYSPNKFNEGLTPEYWKELITNEKTPLTNKAIAGLYSPGSTFKMIVALTALEAGIITPETRFSCNGHITLGNHRFHCWKKEGHGSLNVVEALQHSCDVFFYEIAKKLSIDKLAEMAKRFGLGEKTGIDIPGEKTGLIATRDWKYGSKGTSWQLGETLISCIGQGYTLTTPLQLAMMTSIIANGGKKVFPRLTLDDTTNETPQNLNISSRNMRLVHQGMFNVVNAIGGTASRAKFDVKGMRLSGKTGTTQVRRITMKERETGVIKQEDIEWKYRNHALFVGFAPSDNPRYAVCVTVEHGGSGSGTAAPIASKLIKKALELEASENSPLESYKATKGTS